MFLKKIKDFDPTWLLEAAKKNYPDDNDLHAAITACTKVINGCYFVDPDHPNKPGSEWQYAKSLTIEDTEYGDIVLDILKDGRVGSIEYLNDVLRRK